jgi:hypothetical protein
VAEAKWFGAPLLLVTASWFVDYTVLAVAVLLCATIWLLLHLAGVTVRGSFRAARFRWWRRPEFSGYLIARVEALIAALWAKAGPGSTSSRPGARWPAPAPSPLLRSCPSAPPSS